MGIEGKIENSSLLTDIYGRWPSFHDAEVLRIVIDRHNVGSNHGPYLQAAIHVFEMTSQVDDRGHYILKNHVLAHLGFFELFELSLVEFNRQNVLTRLHLVEFSDQRYERMRFDVSFEGIFGMSASFKCRAISVESVEPYVERED